MFKVLRPLFVVPVRKFCRSGFTLVELLVVIGIIAILAGVALGPITRALKTAKQNAGMQTSRTIALAEFQFANDNSQNYPDTSNQGTLGLANAPAVAGPLLQGGYISDPSIFWLSSSSETKYTGSLTTPTIGQTNISWDFMGNTSGNGVNPNAPDSMPLVWSTVAGATEITPGTSGAQTVTLSTSMPFGTQGVAVTYKSNSAQFIIAAASNSQVTMTTAVYPGWTGNVLKGGG